MQDEWEHAKSLFEAALKQPPEAWPAFVANSCPESVRDEVGRLLARHQELSDFMKSSSQNQASLSESRPPLNNAGDVLARRFRVVRFLARGGMGEVYEAEDLELHEPVALKMIRPDLVQSHPNCLQRFKREVLLAKRVTHPNVCRIFDFFRDSEPARRRCRARSHIRKHGTSAGRNFIRALASSGPHEQRRCTLHC